METRPLLIGGEWRATADAREVRSPFNSELIARFSVASRGEVEESIAAAQRGLDLVAPQIIDLGGIDGLDPAGHQERIGMVDGRHRQHRAEVAEVADA